MFDWLKSTIKQDTTNKRPTANGSPPKRRPTDTRKSPPKREGISKVNPNSRVQLKTPKPLKDQIFKSKEQLQEEARQAERQKRKARGLTGQETKFKINNGTPRSREGTPTPSPKPKSKPSSRPAPNEKPKAPPRKRSGMEPPAGNRPRDGGRQRPEMGSRPTGERKVQPDSVNGKPRARPNPEGRQGDPNALTGQKRRKPPLTKEQQKINKRLEKKYGITEADIHPERKPGEKVSTREKMRRENWGYTRAKNFSNENRAPKEFEIQEVKEEKVVSKRAKISTVKDINDVSFFERINLVTYFNQKESGKFDEKEVQAEYKKNTAILKKESSLKYFLLESARRNLEYGEFPEIKLQIDPHLEDELFNCLESKLLASYDIQVEKQHAILTKMNVDPIIISMRLKVI